jgi:hypothetical protein
MKGDHMTTKGEVRPFRVDIPDEELSEAHYGAANGMSPCISILASEPYFLSSLPRLKT